LKKLLLVLGLLLVLTPAFAWERRGLWVEYEGFHTAGGFYPVPTYYCDPDNFTYFVHDDHDYSYAGKHLVYFVLDGSERAYLIDTSHRFLDAGFFGECTRENAFFVYSHGSTTTFRFHINEDWVFTHYVDIPFAFKQLFYYGFVYHSGFGSRHVFLGITEDGQFCIVTPVDNFMTWGWGCYDLPLSDPEFALVDSFSSFVFFDRATGEFHEYIFDYAEAGADISVSVKDHYKYAYTFDLPESSVLVKGDYDYYRADYERVYIPRSSKLDTVSIPLEEGESPYSRLFENDGAFSQVVSLDWDGDGKKEYAVKSYSEEYGVTTYLYIPLENPSSGDLIGWYGARKRPDAVYFVSNATVVNQSNIYFYKLKGSGVEYYVGVQDWELLTPVAPGEYFRIRLEVEDFKPDGVYKIPLEIEDENGNRIWFWWITALPSERTGNGTTAVFEATLKAPDSLQPGHTYTFSVGDPSLGSVEKTVQVTGGSTGVTPEPTEIVNVMYSLFDHKPAPGEEVNFTVVLRYTEMDTYFEVFFDGVLVETVVVGADEGHVEHGYQYVRYTFKVPEDAEEGNHVLTFVSQNSFPYFLEVISPVDKDKPVYINVLWWEKVYIGGEQKFLVDVKLWGEGSHHVKVALYSNGQVLEENSTLIDLHGTESIELHFNTVPDTIEDRVYLLVYLDGELVEEHWVNHGYPRTAPIRLMAPAYTSFLKPGDVVKVTAVYEHEPPLENDIFLNIKGENIFGWASIWGRKIIIPEANCSESQGLYYCKLRFQIPERGVVEGIWTREEPPTSLKVFVEGTELVLPFTLGGEGEAELVDYSFFPVKTGLFWSVKLRGEGTHDIRVRVTEGGTGEEFDVFLEPMYELNGEEVISGVLERELVQDRTYSLAVWLDGELVLEEYLTFRGTYRSGEGGEWGLVEMSYASFFGEPWVILLFIVIAVGLALSMELGVNPLTLIGGMVFLLSLFGFFEPGVGVGALLLALIPLLLPQR